MTDKINIRVYGIIEKEQKILALYEEYAGEKLLKLPGGGLELGEGTLECLARELDEELNLKLKSATHLYTQDDFIQSRFRLNEQLLTIYYRVEVENIDDLLILDPCIEKTEWIPVQEGQNPFPLPVDHRVFGMLSAVSL